MVKQSHDNVKTYENKAVLESQNWKNRSNYTALFVRYLKGICKVSDNGQPLKSVSQCKLLPLGINLSLNIFSFQLALYADWLS